MPQDSKLYQQIARMAGLRLREQDIQVLSRWTTERLHQLALPNIGQYLQLLAGDSAAARRERELLTVQFSTGESYFFRDQGQFDLLAEKLLPELLERRATQRKLRIWSAGCAAGQETYSLAMLLDELAPRLAGWSVSILGTDISNDALTKARRGAYSDWSFRGLDPLRKRRYFEPRGRQWQIASRLRDRVTFRTLDLVHDRFPDAEADLNEFDLILCRNVLIYLDSGTVSRIAAKFAQALADGGILITGHSELFGHDTTPLRLRMFAQSAVFQKALPPAGGPAPVEAQAPAPASAPPSPLTPERSASGAHALSAPNPPALPATEFDRLLQAAWRSANHGQPEEAEECCRNAISIKTFDPQPYFLLAQLAQERGDTIQAKQLLTKALYLDPSFVAAYLELGALHAQAGDDARARRMHETARTVLGTLPANAAIAPYSESTAAEVITYVERLLNTPPGSAAGLTRKRAALAQHA